MVKVTDGAEEELKRILGTSDLDAGRHLRLATPPVWVGQGDFGIVIDVDNEGDLVIESEGKPLLLVDADLAERLSDSVLDFKDSPSGPAFTLDVY